MIQSLSKFAAFVVTVFFLRATVIRVRKNALPVEILPAKNKRKVLCNKSTQWSEEDLYNLPRNKKSITATRNAENDRPIVTKTKRENENLHRKIEQLKRSFNQPVNHSLFGPTDKQHNHHLQHHTNNGLVSDLKSKFEEIPSKSGVQKSASFNQFHRTLTNVKVFNNFYQNNKQRSTSALSIAKAQSSPLSLSPEPPIVVLRRKRMPRIRLNSVEDQQRGKEDSKTVRSIEEILRQERFSRSLSQYSVSDLCFDESPSEINQDCQRFDELFAKSKSIEDLLDSSPIASPKINRSRSSSSLSRFSASHRSSGDFDEMLDSSCSTNQAISNRFKEYRLSKSASEYSLNELISILDSESFV